MEGVPCRAQRRACRNSLFIVEVLTWRGLVTYSVLFFLQLDTRRAALYPRCSRLGWVLRPKCREAGCHSGLFAQNSQAPPAFKPPRKNAKHKNGAGHNCFKLPDLRGCDRGRRHHARSVPRSSPSNTVNPQSDAGQSSGSASHPVCQGSNGGGTDTAPGTSTFASQSGATAYAHADASAE